MENSPQTIILNNFLYYDINNNQANDLGISGVGYEKCIPEKYDGPKTFPHYSLHVILSGKGHLEIDGHKFDAHANQIVVFPPFATLSYHPDKEDPWEYIWVNFYGINAKRLCQRCSITPVSPIFDHVTPEIIREAQVLQGMHNKRYSKDVAVLGHFYTLFSMMIENIYCNQQAETGENEKLILDVLEYIQKNYSSPSLTLVQVSNAFGFHFNYFSQLFKKITGMNFNCYLNMLRIQRACDLLDNGEKYISDVAHKVGFDDPLYFSKVFKKYKGCPPKLYHSEIGSV